MGASQGKEKPLNTVGAANKAKASKYRQSNRDLGDQRASNRRNVFTEHNGKHSVIHLWYDELDVY